VTENFTAIF